MRCDLEKAFAGNVTRRGLWLALGVDLTARDRWLDCCRRMSRTVAAGEAREWMVRCRRSRYREDISNPRKIFEVRDVAQKSSRGHRLRLLPAVDEKCPKRALHRRPRAAEPRNPWLHCRHSASLCRRQRRPARRPSLLPRAATRVGRPRRGLGGRRAPKHLPAVRLKRRKDRELQPAVGQRKGRGASAHSSRMRLRLPRSGSQGKENDIFAPESGEAFPEEFGRCPRSRAL